jgi:hypothetical protein
MLAIGRQATAIQSNNTRNRGTENTGSHVIHGKTNPIVDQRETQGNQDGIMNAMYASQSSINSSRFSNNSLFGRDSAEFHESGSRAVEWTILSNQTNYESTDQISQE